MQYYYSCNSTTDFHVVNGTVPYFMFFEVAQKSNATVIRGSPYQRDQHTYNEPIVPNVSAHTVKEPKPYLGGGPMNWSFGEWLLVLLVMFVVAKVAKRTNWKSLFRPLKRETKEIKKEWEES